MNIMRRYLCEKNEDGKNYIFAYMLQNSDDYIIGAVVSPESEYTVFSSLDFDVDVSTLEKKIAVIEGESIPVYKLAVESLSFGDEYDACIAENTFIYVSDLERFTEYGVLGRDFLEQMNIYDEGDVLELEFSAIDMSYSVIEQKRKNYLKYSGRTQIKIELTDFFFVEDNIYPEEFELILVIDKRGELSAGCVDKGFSFKNSHPHGVICQSRGGSIFFDDIIAWKPIDGLRLVDAEHTYF